jgi:hypothetical protein
VGTSNRDYKEKLLYNEKLKEQKSFKSKAKFGKNEVLSEEDYSDDD